MPLLTLNNLRTSSISIQDPTGLYGTNYNLVGSGSLVNQVITLAALAAIESILIAEAAASNLTYTITDNPASQADSPPPHQSTALVSPYNAIAGDQVIVTNLSSAGAVSVVLSAAAPVGALVRVVDGKGDGASHNVTVTVAGGGTINGGANSVLNSNFGHATFLKISATAWLVV